MGVNDTEILMLNWNTTTAPAALVAELTAELGPLLPAFRKDDIYITGGRLARAACGLPRGEDIDILLDVDAYSGLRSLMYQAGWRLMQGRSSTGFRGDEEGVHFREKWAPPRDTSFPAIDCLVLTTASQFPEAPGHHRAARAFVATFDYHIGRQLLWWDGDEILLSKTWGAEEAIELRIPGWVLGAERTEERQARWDALLPPQ